MNKHIKVLLLGILLCVCIFSNLCCFADNFIEVYIDNIRIDFEENLITTEDRTLVPMRTMFESLGAKVLWDVKTQTATAIKDDIKIVAIVDSNTILKNNEEIYIDVPAKLVDNKVMVPLRVVSESFDYEVMWNEEQQRVDIRTIDFDTSGNNRIFENNFSKYGDNIYFFLSGSEARIYRLNIKTNNVDIIYSETTKSETNFIELSFMNIYNDKIYFVNMTSGELCAINLDGSDKVVIAENAVSGALIDDDTIYYCENVLGYEEKILEHINDGADNLANFISEVPEGTIYKYNIRSEKKEVIYKGRVRRLGCILDKKLYFEKNADLNYLDLNNFQVTHVLDVERFYGTPDVGEIMIANYLKYVIYGDTVIVGFGGYSHFSQFEKDLWLVFKYDLSTDLFTEYNMEGLTAYNVKDGYIFFTSKNIYPNEGALGSGLFRMKIDGTELEKIGSNDYDLEGGYIVNEYIYYVNPEQYKISDWIYGTFINIYRIKCDGSEQEFVTRISA